MRSSYPSSFLLIRQSLISNIKLACILKFLWAHKEEWWQTMKFWEDNAWKLIWWSRSTVNSQVAALFLWFYQTTMTLSLQAVKTQKTGPFHISTHRNRKVVIINHQSIFRLTHRKRGEIWQLKILVLYGDNLWTKFSSAQWYNFKT